MRKVPVLCRYVKGFGEVPLFHGLRSEVNSDLQRWTVGGSGVGAGGRIFHGFGGTCGVCGWVGFWWGDCLLFPEEQLLEAYLWLTLNGFAM